MKAAKLFSIGDFRTVETDIPKPVGKELLVKVGACGVCGSDLPRIYSHGTSNGRYPLTIGHEFAGTVVDAGKDADRNLIGKRGAFYPLIPCRECDSCLGGHYAMCENYDYMGSRRDGAFAEYILVPSSWHLVESRNPAVPMERLAMMEPACVAQHSLRKADIFPGANVIVYGAGPIGIMAGRWAEIFGALNVLLVDVAPGAVSFAQERGLSCINSNEKNFIERVKEHFNGKLADIAVEGTGYGSALENAVNTVKPFGKITLMGNPAGNTQINQKAHSTILRKEIEIRGMWNSHFSNSPINEWKYAAEMMDKDIFVCEDLVSHRLSLEELPAFVEKMHNREVKYCKVLYKA